MRRTLLLHITCDHHQQEQTKPRQHLTNTTPRTCPYASGLRHTEKNKNRLSRLVLTPHRRKMVRVHPYTAGAPPRAHHFLLPFLLSPQVSPIPFNISSTPSPAAPAEAPAAPPPPFGRLPRISRPPLPPPACRSLPPLFTVAAPALAPNALAFIAPRAPGPLEEPVPTLVALWPRALDFRSIALAVDVSVAPAILAILRCSESG